MGSGPVNWGLIGAGDIAQRRIAPAFLSLESCNLQAVSRADRDRLAEFANRFAIPDTYADWRELIMSPAIDAAYIATPVDLHAVQTIAAAESGKHVLCEKPLGLDSSECARMIDACAASGVRLGVAYYRRFYPVVSRIREILASGLIGRPVYADADAFEWFDPQPDHPRIWLLDRKRSGGGPLMDFGCHRIELMLSLFGEIAEVDGSASNAIFKREVEDTAAVRMRFACGTVGVVNVSHAVAENRDALDIYGTGGSVHVPVLNGGELRLKSGSETIVEFHPPAANIHLPLIEDFTDSILRGCDPAVTGVDGLNVARIIDSVYDRSSFST